jgi:hypothetical protein
MKTLKLVAAGLLIILSGISQAQISINVNITPPSWGPAEASGVRFYYMPDIQVYYDASRSLFFYQSNGVWIHASSLPSSYHFDLYTGYKVMLNDYDGDKPYEHFEDHCKKYPKGYNHGHEQKTYGERPGHGYGDKNHHHDGDGDGDYGNGHGHGHGHGHGNGDHDDDH